MHAAAAPDVGACVNGASLQFGALSPQEMRRFRPDRSSVSRVVSPFPKSMLHRRACTTVAMAPDGACIGMPSASRLMGTGLSRWSLMRICLQYGMSDHVCETTPFGPGVRGSHAASLCCLQGIRQEEDLMQHDGWGLHLFRLRKVLRSKWQR